jgi:dolichyl-phosphate-mannose--protein O-mannosyl transferase
MLDPIYRKERAVKMTVQDIEQMLEHQREKLRASRHRLQQLELREANQGHNTPPEVKIEIRDLTAQIQKQEIEIDRLQALATEARQVVSYREVIRLKHAATGYWLHSHAINYTHPWTSGQQQITLFEGTNRDDYWVIKGPHGMLETYKEGQRLENGDIIRLEHLATKRNLHSHRNNPSPVTGQQEATAFGDNGIGDTNDNWRIEVEGEGEWQITKRVRLIHVNTGQALHSHAGAYHDSFPTGQQEVTCFSGRDDNDWWYAVR